MSEISANPTLQDRALTLLGELYAEAPGGKAMTDFIGVLYALHAEDDAGKCKECRTEAPCFTSMRVFDICQAMIDAIEPPEQTYPRWLKETWTAVVNGDA